jgi:hypothetical protein
MNSAPKLSPKQIRDESWRRGRLGYLLHEGQKRIDEKFQSVTGQLFVCNVARQFGKSYWACTKAVSLAIAKPKTRIRYGTAFHTDLTEFIMPTFDIVLKDCPEGMRPRYKVAGSKWVFPNGSEIKLVGLDRNPNGLRGNTLDLIVIDEAGFVAELDYIYKDIIIPATLKRPNCKIIFISTPPRSPAHEFVDFIQKAEAENSYIKLTIHDNPTITQDDFDRMAKEHGGVGSIVFRREFLCEVISDESHIVAEWTPTYIVETPKDQFYNFYHKYVAMDLGRKDKTALIFGYWDFKRATLVIEDEMEMEGPSWTTLTLKKDLFEKEKTLWATPDDVGPFKPYRRISDNNNPHLINDLNSLHKAYFIETSKESLEAMVNELRVMVGEGKIEVHPRCKKLIGCLSYGVWDSKRKEFARSKVYGHFDHLAALIYLVRNIDRFANPIPRGFGFDVRNSVIKTPKHDSPGIQMLNQIFAKPTRKPTF